MLSPRTVALSVFAWLAAGSIAFADVQLAFRDGNVSIVARDATVGQILAEWAKIGQTEIVNVGKMPGAQMTIELQNVREELALAEVLRALSGYGSTSRIVAVPNASRFDRIVVIPSGAVVATSAPPPAARVSAQAEFQAPAYPPPQSALAPPPPTPASDAAGYVTAGAVSDESQVATDASAFPTVEQRAPVANPARQALEVVDPRKFRLPTPQGGAIGSPTGGVPTAGGSAVPGMIARPSPPPVKPGGPGESPIGRE